MQHYSAHTHHQIKGHWDRSPLSEVPRLGRNIPYIVTFLLFIIITVLTSTVGNYPGLVDLSFIQGFLGGPVLATGGASAADILSFYKIPYGLTFWTCAAYGGPALGPPRAHGDGLCTKYSC